MPSVLPRSTARINLDTQALMLSKQDAQLLVEVLNKSAAVDLKLKAAFARYEGEIPPTG